MTDSLQQQRIDLACALRWAARLGLHEGVCNHFSLAVADEDGMVRGDRFLINPYGWHWSEITASSLVLCDADGNVLEGDNAVEPTAFFIHSRVHLKAPQAVCVLHTHMPYATALTLRGTAGSPCASRTRSCSTAASPTTTSMAAWRWTARKATGSPPGSATPAR